MREENFNVLKCEICKTLTKAVYRNEQIESIGEQFQTRKHLTISFLDWIKNLTIALSDDDSQPI